jgi:hypothetical protein
MFERLFRRKFGDLFWRVCRMCLCQTFWQRLYMNHDKDVPFVRVLFEKYIFSIPAWICSFTTIIHVRLCRDLVKGNETRH